MKTWQSIVLGLLVGILAAAGIYLLAAPPRGTPIQLIPLATPGPITVYITGEVNNPGVFTLPRQSRVSDAVQAAGGLLASADTLAINLAARLNDSDRIIIPAIAATPAPSAEKFTIPLKPTPSPTVNFPIDLNHATLEQLDALPGIGATRAAQIIDYRKNYGGFKRIEDLMNVPGIGQSTFSAMKHLITVTPLEP